MILGLYGRKALADDAGLPLEAAPEGKSIRVSLAYNTRTRDEVDAVLEEARAAGAEIVKPAEEVFWGGYSGLLRRSRRSPLGSRLEPALPDCGGRLDPASRIGPASVPTGHMADRCSETWLTGLRSA